MKNKPSRTYKDGVFRSLFSEKDKMLELYNAVNDTDYGEEMLEKIQVLTIDNPLYLGIRNDLAFSMPDKAIFFTEHQSTLCGNIDIRMLAYMGEVIQTMYSDEIYREKPLKMPPPEFFVIYNGAKETPAEKVFTLSDHYICKPQKNSVELVVKFINVCYDKDNEILKKSRTLREYSLLMSYIDESIKAGEDKDEAIAMAVKRANSEGILKDFLKKNASEVIGMLHGEVTMERYGEIRKEEGKEEGYEMGFEAGQLAGHESGFQEGCLETAKKFKGLNVPSDIIAEATGLSEEEIEKL